MSIDPVALKASIKAYLVGAVSRSRDLIGNLDGIAASFASAVAAVPDLQPAADGTAGTMSGADKTKLDAYATTPGTNQGEVIHVNIDVPLATLQGKTSGTAFNIGAALPANARLLRSCINLIQVFAGGTISAAVATVQNTGETAGALQASTNVFTGAAIATTDTAGSNPHPNRGGQQLQMTVTQTTDTNMAHLATGHLSVDLYYAVVP